MSNGLALELALELTKNSSPYNYIHFEDSPFFNFTFLAPRSKGKIGETLVRNCCLSKNIRCEKALNSQHDLIINGKRIEIKTSFINKDNRLLFQQIRINQNWDFIIFVGFYTNDVKVWCMTKSYIEELVKQNIIVKQHSKENLWVWIDGYNIPNWLLPKSARIEDVMKLFLSEN